MCNRTSRFAIILAVALLPPGLAVAQKLDKDDKQFLDDVRPILLQDEEKTFKGLKDKSDRLEFQKIFWARRDPDLATPENEFQTAYTKAREEAERTYRMPTQAGSMTDCGRTFILLGKPDEVQRESSENPGLRAPETWTYRSRPGQAFTGGKAVIAFDADCRAPAGFSDQLDRIARAKVVQPSLDYRVGKDGHLTKLVDLLPKDTAARALFKQPKQDFPLAVQAGYLKVADGGTALLGLVRGEAGSLAVVESGGTKAVNLSIAASAVGADGKEAGWTEQTLKVPVGADGAFVSSFKLGLKPGQYTLKAGAVDVKDGKASLASMPVDVPDLSRVEAGPDGAASKVATAGSVFVVRGIEEITGGSDPQHPFAAFELGRVRLIPAFGGVLRKSEQVEFFYQVYDLRLDPATGKANATAVVSVLKEKDKATVAKAPANQIETEFSGSSVGPVPLAGFEPGKYVVQLKVTDKVAKKELVQEAPLEVVP
ncbi:MAG TPA: GWxTD domain-containing protein [Vicinamibacteria bacterium]|nr:GWxTD domain-containing protein [Vicinamibacteria bacterium]